MYLGLTIRSDKMSEEHTDKPKQSSSALFFFNQLKKTTKHCNSYHTLKTNDFSLQSTNPLSLSHFQYSFTYQHHLQQPHPERKAGATFWSSSTRASCFQLTLMCGLWLSALAIFIQLKTSVTWHVCASHFSVSALVKREVIKAKTDVAKAQGNSDRTTQKMENNTTQGHAKGKKTLLM